MMCQDSRCRCESNISEQSLPRHHILLKISLWPGLRCSPLRWHSFCLQMRDRARRFITLLDELYNAKTPLYISAAAQPMDLFNKPGDEPVLDLESLQSETAVRIIL